MGDSVQVKGGEGHHGDGQGEGEAGGQRQEFAVVERTRVRRPPRYRGWADV